MRLIRTPFACDVLISRDDGSAQAVEVVLFACLALDNFVASWCSLRLGSSCDLKICYGDVSECMGVLKRFDTALTHHLVSTVTSAILLRNLGLVGT